VGWLSTHIVSVRPGEEAGLSLLHASISDLWKARSREEKPFPVSLGVGASRSMTVMGVASHCSATRFLDISSSDLLLNVRKIVNLVSCGRDQARASTGIQYTEPCNRIANTC
jgi:hypothetical protein